MDALPAVAAIGADSTAIASRLRQVAEILHAQGANPFRVAAYRRAAEVVGQQPDLHALYARSGRDGLAELPGIGAGLAAAIAEMIDTGRWALLDRLRGSVEPATLFATVPGIGPSLAERIHDALGIDTLEALEAACVDGRLAQVPGMGSRRLAAIRASLAAMLNRVPRAQRAANEPPVEMLLDVDRQYRDQASRGELPTIAPRRFNPEGKSWLPILHTRRDNWHFTALYSNTATAHELDRTRDWVVLYFDSDHHGEQQRTVVTEHRGRLRGRRVVRGRESDCIAHYARMLTPINSTRRAAS
jgi:hypothetical protein